MKTEDLSKEFETALLNIDRVTAKTLLFEKIPDHGNPLTLFEELIIPAMDNIGRGWEEGSVSLSQVYMSGRICESLVNEILPSDYGFRQTQPKIAIAVLDDYHSLGKKIVYSVLRASGFAVIDYGTGLSPRDLAARTQKDNLDILLISVLMLPSALHVGEVRKFLNEENVQVKIIVGGAPFRFDSELWKEVGADAMGKRASDAVGIINTISQGAV